MTLFDNASSRQLVPTRRRLAAIEAAWIAENTRVRPASHSCEDRKRLVRKLAYLRAERRGFAPGHEVEDWLAAERDLERTSQSRFLV